jgi:hypothetical protein
MTDITPYNNMKCAELLYSNYLHGGMSILRSWKVPSQSRYSTYCILRNRAFAAVFTTARHLTLSLVRLIQSTPSHHARLIQSMFSHHARLIQSKLSHHISKSIRPASALSSHPHLDLSLTFSSYLLNSLLFPPMWAMYPAQLTILDLVTLITFGEQ